MEITVPEKIADERYEIEFYIENLSVVDNESLQIARDTLVRVNDLKKKVSGIADPFVKSANEAVTAARNQRKKLLEPIENLISVLKSKMEAYAASVRKAEQEKAKEISEATGIKPSEVPRQAPPAGFRKVYGFEIIDIEKVPREYFLLDEKRIGALARAEKENFNIPGLKLTITEAAVAR
jgi:hypothetical protein